MEGYQRQDPAEVKARYEAAVASFVDKVKADPGVIAVIMGGSLAYDTVWEKSDIDMTVVIRDQSIDIEEFCIDEDGIPLNVHLTTRTNFKRALERSKGGDFFHSYITKGRIVHSTDEGLYEFFEEARKVGTEDMELSLFHGASNLIGLIHKIEKWLYVKDDPTYARFYILKAAEVVAAMEVCLHRVTPTREAILQAEGLNPDLVRRFYRTPMAGDMTREAIIDTVAALEGYLDDHLGIISRPALDYLADGGIKTVTMISRYFKIGVHGGTHVFEYLAEKGLIDQVNQTVRITPKGRKIVEEVAFMYVERAGEGEGAV